MNKVILIANLVRDPEMATATNGMAICKFTVACNNGKDKDGNERPADFITCKAFDKKAETIGRYFKKGKPICVTGSFKTDKYQDKSHDDVTHYSSYVLVNEFEFVGGKGDGGSAESEKPAEKPATKQEAVGDIPEADIPF